MTDKLTDYTQCRSCATCKWGMFQDVGYSNYTVEGTEFYCMQNKHPNDGFDSFYGHDSGFGYGMTCDFYVAGEGISIDVEREKLLDLEPDERIRFDVYLAGSL